ncbi:MAG: glutamate formimidoyltransferase [Chloroflexi bacterium]|nr:glutamate formimidoyltransferase [Chloroflexota bacterium]
MKTIVECVANFSEGRREKIVDQIVDSIAGFSGVDVLGAESDMDHNRSVVTFAGAPHAVANAAFASVQVAATMIDMNQHRGQHPRIGAADVIPFVPLRNVTMAECVELARSLGARVGEALQLPVFLYAEAALQEENRELSAIRRGGYESLRESIKTGVAPQPDFGPGFLHSPGGSVIGARDILIAFNVYLATTDVSIAKAIARAIRQSSGGMPSVKALGFFVKGRAQVSLNLTDYRVTSMSAAFERIRQLAAEYGVGIDGSEIIGLIPGAALDGRSAAELQIMNYGPDRILETFLDEAQ